MVLSGVTVLCSSGMKSVYLFKKVCSVNFFCVWFPKAHWCTVQWDLVVCHEEEKKSADMLWSEFIFK